MSSFPAVKSRYITGLADIKAAYAKMSPASRKQLREYVQFNSELICQSKLGKRHKGTMCCVSCVMVWSLCAVHYLSNNRRLLAGAWNLGERPSWMSQESWQASLDGPSGPSIRRHGITTNQMRALVGLPPIKGALEKQVSSKSNPKGLRSRAAR